MSRRSEQLLNVARKFTESHNAWVNDKNSPYPDESYWDAADQLIETFERGDIPGSLRPLAEAIELFAEEFQAFDDRDDVNNQYPKDSFWSARQRIEDVLKKAERPTLKPLETIKELNDQKVTHEQIAKIYGFVDRRGNLMPWLVQQELDSPGSVIKAEGGVDGKTWKDPRVEELESCDEKDFDDEDEYDDNNPGRLPSKSARASLRRKQKAAEEESKPCPETPHDLWEQRVSVEQSAKMLRMREDKVREMFQKWDDEAAAKSKDAKKDKEKVVA